MKRSAAEARSARAERRRSSVSEGRELVDAWQASGLPVAQFSRSRGIAEHRVHYWKRRLCGRAGESSSCSRSVAPPEFFAVDLASAISDAADSDERNVHLWICAGRDVRIEIPGSVSRETFIRTIRWTVEAMQS